MILPVPQQYLRTGNRVKLPSNKLLGVHGDYVLQAEKWLLTWGLVLDSSHNLLISISLKEEADRKVTEAYRLEINTCKDQQHIAEFKLYCSCERGMRNGLNTIAKLLENAELESGTIEDYPKFRIRGMIEGFYGWPWKQPQRLSMLEVISKYNMNCYFYAPKDDLYLRDKWYERYDTENLSILQELVEKARQCCLDFYYCLSPGITISYTNQMHFESLIQKLQQVYALGVRHFGILLDDIPNTLQYPEDKERFPSIAEAHAYFVNRLVDYLQGFDASIRLALCPLQYYGSGEEEYIRAFSALLPKDVMLFWTGENICSQKLTVAAAQEFREYTGHAPLYWDNYPVNDANMVNEMHLGPVIGREKELYHYSHGIIANGMPYCEASKIPYITIADFLWNPDQYRPEGAWSEATRRIVGENDAPVFMYFAEHMRRSCLQDDMHSASLAKCLFDVRFHLKTGQKAVAEKILERYLDGVNRCEQMLKSGMENSVLQKELSRWEEKFFVYCKLLNLAYECIRKRDDKLVSEILAMQDSYNNMCAVLTDFCFEEFLDEVTQKFKEEKK